MQTQFKSKYPLWGEVKFDDGTVAIITGIQFSSNIIYRLDWFSQGDRRSVWFLEAEIEHHLKQSKFKIGFKVEK